MAFCDYCAGSPCQAGEQCVSGSSGFTCVQQPLDYCDSSPCQNGGTCTNEASGFSCACEPGFGGPICAGSVCPLIYSPVCGNDDVTYANDCLMSAASVSLQCHGPCPCPTVAGTTAGEYCASSPCQNGGTCINEASGFTCDCNPGFGGPICAETSAACDSSPCLNFGSCVNTPSGFFCYCMPGYDGTVCEIPW